MEKTYDTLRVLVIGERQGAYRTIKVPSPLQFDCDRDILGIPELLQYIQSLETTRLDELAAIIGEELKSTAESAHSPPRTSIGDAGVPAREILELLRRTCHGVIEALKLLWMDHGGDMKDLAARHAGHHLEALGHLAAHFEPVLPGLADTFSLLARVSRKPYATLGFTASSTTEYLIRHGIDMARCVDAALRDRTIRRQEPLTDEEREVYRRCWCALREPFSNSGMLPTYGKCIGLAAEVDWEFHRAVGLLESNRED